MDTTGAGGVGGPPHDDGHDAERTGPSRDTDPALKAMAAAARRAREATSSGRSWTAATGPPRYLGGDETVLRPPPVPGRPASAEASGPESDVHLAADTIAGGEAGLPSRRRLPRLAELGIAAGLLAVVVALIALNAGGGSSSSRTRALARANHPPSTALVTPSAAPTSTTIPSPPPTTAPPAPSTTPATTSLPAAPPGGGPELASLSPAEGTTGQVVVVSGANLISSDGQILARFNGAPAPTRCPTRTSCNVTVPAISGAPSSITVTVTTAEGTSNPLTFSYSG